MFQKCQMDTILPFGDIPILSICCTLQGLNTQIHHHRNPKLSHVHKQHSDTLWDTLRTSPNNIRHYQTPTDTNRHQQMPLNLNMNRHTSLKQPFGVSGDVLGRLLASVCHFCCHELSVDVWKRCLRAFKWSVCMFFGFGCVKCCTGVFDIVWCSKSSLLE